jgi:hypothetical protein
VANEVETEQILCEPNAGHLLNESFSSFVQIRGSIPLFWSQDNTGGVPKPLIQGFLYLSRSSWHCAELYFVVVQKNDPFHSATIRHFSDLLQRNGAPIVALNLVRVFVLIH